MVWERRIEEVQGYSYSLPTRASSTRIEKFSRECRYPDGADVFALTPKMTWRVAGWEELTISSFCRGLGVSAVT